ncbi:calcium-translocating P-type ATPase, SERCA-type [Clostridium sp.]|jgi:Ca2+-transporting ATPase|uniref:calcium-translocating P-type ATPase, SERCA-type n=1 Tax=Clostridium sp. TaxID=1506 RepID=UPI00258F491B|nr:calcium-translocating P-type ATPase, SERCA-type [Clostridium sp.]MDF2504517.1 plasma-rane calcium-translocating P-type ATPase [Clostridium sp.]
MINEKEIYRGLTSEEAEERIKKYGANILEKKKTISAAAIFLSQFNDFIIWVLIGATIISGLMGEKADAATIIIIIIMNAILGFVQEFRTEKSLEALKEMASPTAKVIRDGNIQVISAEDLVPGDLILIESGDKIPADAIVVQASNIKVDESLLTGESVGVEKTNNAENSSIYMGSIVLTGKGEARIVETGMNTEMGKIANLLQGIDEEKTPLKEKLASLGRILVILCIIICVIVTALGIVRGQDKYEMFLLGVSLAVAAIPEGLPAIVTVALALGVSRMLKRNALIRKLPAVETLGCTSIICSDKTGTLTQNVMTVKSIYYDGKMYSENSFKENKLLQLKKVFTYCNDSDLNYNEKNFNKALMGDPTETALIKAFFGSIDELKRFLNKAKRISEIPFDSNRKMMSVILSEQGNKISYVKGAPERIIERCKYIFVNGEKKLFTSDYKNRVQSAVDSMANKALRCIGAAYRDGGILTQNNQEKELVFLGLAGMIDPPREEVKPAVLKCKEAGIKPIMITGDHKNTAFAIGKELDICSDISEVITGEELDRLDDKKLSKVIDKAKIFARVSPEHKLRIVRAFKRKNKIVAMTGDGVNDAPAVKEADIGISMGISGTDVTKEASSMILLDDNFTTIVSAVEEGRVIYNNIRKFIRYLLSCNLGEVLTMFLASLLYLDTPLLPIQILLVNLATDGLPAIALGVDPADKDVMYEKPRAKDESIFARGLKEKIIIRGCLIGVCTVLSFLVGKYFHFSLETSRTIALGTLIMSQLIHVFECRSEKHSIFEIKLFTNLYLVGAVSLSIALLMAVIYVPFLSTVFHTSALNIGQWLIIIFFSGFISMINSLYLLFNKK